MIIKRKGYILRPWETGDAISLAENINNKKIWDNVRDSLPYPYTVHDAQAYIEYTQDTPYHQNFAIVVKDKAVGSVGISPCVDVERISAEIGYWLGEVYWGHGFTSDAVKTIAEYTFQHTDIIRLYASVYEYNKASMRVLEKAGFTQLCTLHKAAIKNGVVLNMPYYELIKPD